MAGIFSRSPFSSKKDERIYTVDDEIRIVLLGKTGSGKSHTGNTILGDERFHSKFSAASVTKLCKQQAAIRKDKKIILVDTPGLFDDQLGNDVTKQEVAKCIGLTAPGVHCFLLVVQIGRFSPEEKNAIQEFLSMFGGKAKNYMIVLFTKIDTIPVSDQKKKDQERFEEYLKEITGDLRAVIELCGNRCIGFNNTDKKRREKQVNTLFDMIDNMVKENGGSCYTNEMYMETERKIQEAIEMKRKEEEEKEKKEQEEIRRKIEEEMEKEKKRELEKKLQKMRDDHDLKQKVFEEKMRTEIRSKMEKAEPGVLAKLAGGVWDFVTFNWF